MTVFAYVFPCAWEDHCKIGFSRDPLARIAQLHPRWFEFFDLASGFLVEAETERDARDLELELRRPLVDHRAPQPLTVRDAAGGRTEWVRGAAAPLRGEALRLRAAGHRLHAPLAQWLRDALQARAGLLYEWTERLPFDATDGDAGAAPVAQRTVRDALDAHVALGIDLAPWLPERVLRWHAASNRHFV